MKLNARQLRDVDETLIAKKIKSINRHPIYFILDNIYDTYNIGGLFRLADALSIKKIYICGQSEIPPNHKIKKASIGTYKVVNWEYKKTAKEAIEELRSKFEARNTKQIQNSNFKNSKLFRNSDFPLRPSDFEGQVGFRISIIAVEQTPDSVPYTKIDYSFPVAFIFGNETSGVSQEALKLADYIAEIPMYGVNKSLNVIVSAAIVSYWAMNCTTGPVVHVAS